MQTNKKRQAFIFSVDDNPNEENYSKMALLLIRSIKDTNPDIDIHCGIFTDRISSDILNEIAEEFPEVNIHLNIVFSGCETQGSNYFLRNYTCWYFGELLLKDYDQLIYVDIDAIVLKEFNYTLEENSIVVEQVPDSIKKLEEPWIGVVKGNLYYNWWTIITPSNLFIWDMPYFDSNELLIEKNACVEVSARINRSKLKIINQEFGAYYPKHKLTSESVLFHYDGFIDSGSFWRLKAYSKKLYKKYKLYTETILGLNNENNTDYWKGFQIETL